MLGDRIKILLEEKNLKQTQFAKTLGISSNYVNLLVNNKKFNISETLAKLIEETYGYSSKWILEGTGSMKIGDDISANKLEILKKIDKMSEEDIRATLAFAKNLESVDYK